MYNKQDNVALKIEENDVETVFFLLGETLQVDE